MSLTVICPSVPHVPDKFLVGAGLQFLQHRESEGVFQDIPVIIVSTEGREEDTVLGLKAGASAYVKKPFQPSVLHALVEKIMTGEA